MRRSYLEHYSTCLSVTIGRWTIPPPPTGPMETNKPVASDMPTLFSIDRSTMTSSDCQVLYAMPRRARKHWFTGGNLLGEKKNSRPDPLCATNYLSHAPHADENFKDANSRDREVIRIYQFW